MRKTIGENFPPSTLHYIDRLGDARNQGRERSYGLCADIKIICRMKKPAAPDRRPPAF
jgi:hypothetical protein